MPSAEHNHTSISDSTLNEHALSDIRVLDLSRVLAGPWCTQTLGDLGAEIIKIERPGTGDDTRSWGPPWLPGQDDTHAPDSSYYAAANRGKKSLTLDISTPEGQAIIRDLARQSDVFIENYKIGNLKKYGLDYDSIKSINPSIIYCSITGFGQDGPFAHRPGYDFVFQGMGGMMSITGERDDLPGGGPQKVGIALADIITGMYASIAILAAINHKKKSGEGQYIDLSLLDCIIALGSNQITGYFASGNIPKRMGNAHMSLVPYGVYPSKDGHIIIAIGNDDQWQRLCQVLQRADLAQSDQYTRVTDRIINRDQLDIELNKTLQQQTSSHWLEVMEAQNVPCGPINNYQQVFENEQVIHRKLRLEQHRYDGARTVGAASPMNFSKTPVKSDLPPPTIGQNTKDILVNMLKMDEVQIRMLQEKNII